MEIKIVTLEPKPAVAIRDTCTFAELGNKFGEIYTEIGTYLKKISLHPDGAPYGLYHSFSPEKVDLEAGIPVSGDIAGEGRIKPVSTYGGKAAMTTFTGHYDKLHEAWGEFAKLVDSKGYELAGPCFEVYITDPEMEPDSSKWVTELYTPIA